MIELRFIHTDNPVFPPMLQMRTCKKMVRPVGMTIEFQWSDWQMVPNIYSPSDYADAMKRECKVESMGEDKRL